jgi:hypothetical protein
MKSRTRADLSSVHAAPSGRIAAARGTHGRPTHRAPLRLACAALLLVIASAFLPSAAYPTSFYWQDEQCWQAGQIGSESFSCENAAEPNFLATHVLPEEIDQYKLSTSGQYCTYSGIPESIDKAEESGGFKTPAPTSEYQEGNGNGSLCAAWAFPSQPMEWGLQLDNPSASNCNNITPNERCNIQRYISLAGQELNDRPWASYFGIAPSLSISDNIEPLLFQPHLGAGWGYICAIVEDRTTGNILELCFENWRSVNVGTEWQYEHVEDCHNANPELEHDVDRIVLPTYETSEFVNGFGEPIETLSGLLHLSTAVSSDEMEQLVKLDDSAFTEKESSPSDPGARYEEPEIGTGCGRASSKTPAEWALIGVSNGMESWKAHMAQTKLVGSVVKTTFEPIPPEIALETPKSPEAEQVTLAATINPHGAPTKYVVEYGQNYGGEYRTTAALFPGSGITPEPLDVTLTGLSPGTVYYYQIKAFHFETYREEFGVTYSPEGTFATTEGPHCSGKAIAGQGSTLQARAQQSVWDTGFNTSANGAACNGTQGSKAKPSITYTPTGSGAGLESWGVNKKTANYSASNAFIATDEPPNEQQKAEIESRAQKPVKEALLTIPVLQDAVALVVHLPKGCKATSTKAPGRLVLQNKALNNLWLGKLATWGALMKEEEVEGPGGGDKITPASCLEKHIKHVVRLDQSGTTHQLKKYLGLIGGEKVPVENDKKEAVGSKSWGEVAEASENQSWPTADAVIRPAAAGGAEEAAKVAAEESSIGYVNLADARANTKFAPPEGGAEKESFWVELQNSGTKTETESDKLQTYADPATNGEAAASADANCYKEAYTDGVGDKFPPKSVKDTWNNVTSETKQKNYPLCGITYDLALDSYYSFTLAPTEGQIVRTVSDYFGYMLNAEAAGGQVAIEGHDYEALPGNVQKIAAAGVKEID